MKKKKKRNRLVKIEQAVVSVAKFKRVTNVGCIKKVEFEQKSEEGESVSHVDIWRGVFQVVERVGVAACSNVT